MPLRLRGRRAPGAGTDAVRAPETAVAPPGVVETFTRGRVVGWVSVDADAPPTRVTLHVGSLQVSATYATEDAPLSGFSGEPEDGGDLADGGGRRPVPGPAGDRRNSRRQVRMFSFRIRGLWPFLRKSTRVTVRVDGAPLPIAGHGMYLTPPRNGSRSVRELRSLFEEGHVLTQFGQVALSKTLDSTWQARVMALYTDVRAALREAHGYDAFLVYGTLLGAVRESGYISHDADFDAAYVSDRRSGPEAAEELVEVALTLIEHGFVVDARERLLHVHDPEDPSYRIDLFHVFADQSGNARFPWGVAGSTTLPVEVLRDLREVDFPGGRSLVPVRGEQVVAHLYGEDWRLPKPGWTWDLARTDAALDALLSSEQRSKVYWADFYARKDPAPGSSFFELLAERPDTPQRVVDIGCGDGRDSCAFGETGRTVLGLDQSAQGIEHAVANAEARGLSDRVRFQVCDVTDGAALEQALAEARGVDDAPVLHYLRFFLHAIGEGAQDALLQALQSASRPGDLLAAEFRTDKDEANAKVHGNHYRRYQNAMELVRALETRHGYDVVDMVESAGLSPYGSEDPVLCRVLARPRAGSASDAV